MTQEHTEDKIPSRWSLDALLDAVEPDMHREQALGLVADAYDAGWSDCWPEADRAGFRRAIEALRDSDRYLAYHREANATGALPEADRQPLLRIHMQRAAAYLESLTVPAPTEPVVSAPLISASESKIPQPSGKTFDPFVTLAPGTVVHIPGPDVLYRVDKGLETAGAKATLTFTTVDGLDWVAERPAPAVPPSRRARRSG